MTEEMIKFSQLEHIVDIQAENETAFLTEFAQGDFTLESPLVKLNPYVLSPLSAVVLFKTSEAVSVHIAVEGKEPAGTITHDFPKAKEHILPIYGLYANYKNRINIKLSNGKEHTLEIKTEEITGDVPEATSINTTAEYMGENFMFLTAAMRAVPVAYDYRGDIRWYADRNLVFDLKRIENGHILVGTERLVKMPYFTTGLYEMDFSGKIYKEYQFEGGYHHDQIEMENGDIITLSFDFDSGTVEDEVVLLDAKTGLEKKRWDLKEVLPQDVAGSGSQDEHDWFHNNSVYYDEKNNALILSGRHQDAIISIDYDTSALNWIIGDPEGWPEEMVEKYFFTPIGEGDFDWQYEQHAALVLPDGDIFVFDNGHFRSKNPDHYIKNSENFSRGVRYRINTDDMTIQQIWQYGKERGPEFFSPYISNVEYYDEGHYMVHSGGVGYENGKICDGFAVTRSMSPKHKDKTYTFNSITCELKDDELVYELQVPANFYRAEKMPIYADNEVFEKGAGVVLGQMGITKPTRMKVRSEETGELIPEHYQASIEEEKDRIKFNATFESGDMAQLYLIDEQGDILRYQIDTISKNFNAMCVGTFQKADPRNTDLFINKRGLSGTYTIQLMVEKKIYETGVTITV